MPSSQRGQWAKHLTSNFSDCGWMCFICCTTAILISIFAVCMSLSLDSVPHGVIGNDNSLVPLASDILGWAYFLAWSISFYPQLFLNWQRQSVVGMSFDFCILNCLGYVCYSTFSFEFFQDKHIQTEYQQLHNGHQNLVKVQDFVFAAHGLVLSVMTTSQIWCFGYKRGNQRVSWGTIGFVATTVAVAIVYGGLCTTRDSSSAGTPDSFFTWVNFLYYLSLIKLAVSAIKYIPQAVLNCRRKSTEGWNIWNVLLDCTGGILSFAQLLLDAAHAHDWSAVLGDPVKFGLSVLSIGFDVLFMIQHYILYPERLRQKRKLSQTHEIEEKTKMIDEETNERHHLTDVLLLSEQNV